MSTPAQPPIDVDQYRTLSFDCYGTLIDWEAGILGYLQPLFLSRDVHVIDEFVLTFFSEAEPDAQAAGGDYRTVLANVLERFAVRLGFVASASDLADFGPSIEYWPPFPDTVAALKKLSTRFELAVVSNVDADLFEFSRRMLGVDFAHVVTAGEVGRYKPDRGMFDAALAAVDAPVLHIAQSRYHDIVPATELGLDTVWINRTGIGAARAVDANPTWEFPDLVSFIDHLGL